MRITAASSRSYSNAFSLVTRDPKKDPEKNETSRTEATLPPSPDNKLKSRKVDCLFSLL